MTRRIHSPEFRRSVSRSALMPIALALLLFSGCQQRTETKPRDRSGQPAELPAARAAEEPVEATPADRSDVIVVGAGISGLSAALDLARGGATVTVIDMSSVFGGHAV